MIKLSAAIVSHNSRSEIAGALNSIYNNTSGVALEVYVVDNNSADGTADFIKNTYPQVKLIENSKNIGFGRANNQILKFLDSDFHFIINPDITFETNILKDLAEYLCQNEDVIMVTPKVLNKDGSQQHLPKINPTFHYMLSGTFEKFGGIFAKWRAQYTMGDAQIVRPIDIDFCTGCFMMVRTAVFKKLSGFDEQFFLYLEDADITRRAKKYGRVVFHPDYSVVHSWHRGSLKNLKLFFIHIHSMMKYFWKWKKKKG